MRTISSVKNSFVASTSMIIKIIIGFVAQKIFIIILNAEYLGVNGLFSNIITLFALAELGIGQAIIFNLYKPIANDDKETIKSLLRLYKKAYNIIAIVVLALGLAIIPFLDFFIGETTLNLNFTFVYILFLMQSVASYIFTYKRSILYAYQENYIISIVDSAYILVINIIQLCILYLTKNYYLYLGIKIIGVLIGNFIINCIANRKYNFINEKNVQLLDKKIEQDIFVRIKAQLFHKIGGIVVNGTDNIIISKYIGLVAVGHYSNYYMIIYSVSEIIKQLINSIIPSVGNLLVENNKEKSFDIYKKVRFLNFWISTFSAVSILVLIQSFVELWLGKEYLLSIFVVSVLVLNFYLKTMRTVNDVFLIAAGICVETKYVPIVESLLNIVFSIILIKPFGLAGVFIGTIISSLPLWCFSYPKYGYKNILGGRYSNYIKENGIYFLLFSSIAIITYRISMEFTILNLWLKLIAKGLLCLIVPNLILFIIYRKSDEFEYFKNLMKYLLKINKQN